VKLLGIFEVHRLRRHEVSGRRELPWDVLFQDLSPAARAAVAKVARSEVKNYLAELAELCEMPFVSPEGFVQALRTSAFITVHGPAEDESRRADLADEDVIYLTATDEANERIWRGEN
jgi:hypothetical protein